MVRAISNNDNEPLAERPNDFTPSTATKMLPLVRRIVKDLVALNQSIEAQREQLSGVDDLPETIDQPDYREELSDVRRSLADDELQFAACLDELASLGLQAHLPIDGSIDFPAMMNRRRVCLCWNPEDKEVMHWHEIGEAKENRQAVDPQAFPVESLN